MVSTFPAKKNAAFKAVFPILDADGDLVTGATGLDSEVSIDGGTFADCTNEATEIATSSGMYYLNLTAAEMNGDVIAVIVKTTTTGAKTTALVYYTSAQTLDELDAIADAVKAQTDLLAFTSGNVHSHVKVEDNIDFGATKKASINTEVDGGIETYRLHELMTNALGSQPAAGSLLGDLSEDDGGTQRFNANALEQAPTGGTNPNVLVSTTIAVVTTQTEFTLTAGSNDDDAYDNQSIVLYDASDADYPSVRVITNYVGATKTVTIDSAPDFAIIAGDGVKVFVTAPGTTAPTAGENADAVWNEAISEHVGAGSFGLKNQKAVPSETINDYKATGFSTHSAAAVWAVGTRTLTSFGTLVQDIWDKLTSGLTTAGSIGKLLVDNVNAAISSRSSHTAANVWAAGSRELSTPNSYKADVSSLALEATLTAMKGDGWTDESLKGLNDAIAALNNLADSEVWAYATRILTDPNSYKADVSALALEASITDMKGLGWTDESLKDIQDLATALKKLGTNRWKVLNNQLIIYDDDSSTPLYTFNLKDSAGVPAMENVYERVPA